MSTRRVSRKSGGSSSTRVSTTTSSARKSSSSSRRHDAAIEDEENEESNAQVEVVDTNEEGGEDEAAEEEPAAATPKPRGGRKGGRSSPFPSSSARRAQAEEDEQVNELEDTPTRLSRLDEKSELQGLNKRLEFYILKQRERDASADAWGRELANLKNKHAADLEHQKNLFENQLGIVRKNRDEVSAKLSKLEGENAQSVFETNSRDSRFVHVPC
jgi:hypothetical protein